jgi:1-acyl-sn-glycerol-3-phosphate acyltransferase
MNFRKNIPFAFWMYCHLLRLRADKKAIEKCRRTGDVVQEREAILQAASPWSGGVLNHYGVALTVEGYENIPAGPVLFVANHQGYADIVVFLAAMREKQIGFVAKESLSGIPFFGKWIRRIRSIFLVQDNNREAVRVFQEGENLLREGFSLVIFPEGHRSMSDGMKSFRKGSFRLATKTGVPIVPVSIHGTWHLYEEKGYPCPGKVRFFIHPPIVTTGLTKSELFGLSEQTERLVRTKIDQWNAEQLKEQA